MNKLNEENIESASTQVATTHRRRSQILSRIKDDLSMRKFDIHHIRNEIPALSRSIYMNTGGTGPLPRAVTSEISSTYVAAEQQGPDVPDVRDHIQQQYQLTRKIAASFLGVDHRAIAFVRCISEGLNIVASGMNWQSGDEVIVTSEEHPSGILLWLNLANRMGIQIKKLSLASDLDNLLDRLDSMISKNTRLLSLSHVTTDTGIRLPAAEICKLAHQRGIPVMFDGAQSVGQFPINLEDMDCDFYVSTGHKWLLGGWGTGVLYIREDWINRLNVAWTGAYAGTWDTVNDTLDFHEDARRFEFGGRHHALYNAMGKGIDFVNAVGTDVIENRVMMLTERIKSAILEISGAELLSPESRFFSTGILTFSIHNLTGTELDNLMWTRWKIRGRPSLNQTAMRVCTAFFNTIEEVDKVISAIEILSNENK